MSVIESALIRHFKPLLNNQLVKIKRHRKLAHESRNTTGKGYFQTVGRERLSKQAMHVRLPQLLDAKARKLAGDDLSGWLRKAIIAQIDREELQKRSHPLPHN